MAAQRLSEEELELFLDKLAEVGGRPLASDLRETLKTLLTSPAPKGALPFPNKRQQLTVLRALARHFGEIVRLFESDHGRGMAVDMALGQHARYLSQDAGLWSPADPNPMFGAGRLPDAYRSDFKGLLRIWRDAAESMAKRIEATRRKLEGGGGRRPSDTAKHVDEIVRYIYDQAARDCYRAGKTPPDEFTAFRNLLCEHLPAHLSSSSPAAAKTRPRRARYAAKNKAKAKMRAPRSPQRKSVRPA
jgi:hypothetical protein